MKGKHAKELAVPKRMQAEKFDEEEQYNQILSKADELFQEKILQDKQIQEMIQKAMQQQEAQVQPHVQEIQQDIQNISRQSLWKRLKEKTKQLTKKQITACSTLMIMIANMFSPYTTLLSTVKAAVNPTTDTLVVVSASPLKDTPGGKKYVEITYAITGENLVGFDFNLEYDPTKIQPAYYDELDELCEPTEIVVNKICGTIPERQKSVAISITN